MAKSDGFKYDDELELEERVITVKMYGSPAQKVKVDFKGMFNGRDIQGAQRHIVLEYRKQRNEVIRLAKREEEVANA